MDARPSHRVDRGVALVEQRLAGDHFEFRAVLGRQIEHCGCEILWHHVARWGVDQVADPGHRPGLYACRFGRRGGPGKEFRGRWCRLFVPLEAIRGECPAERGPFKPARRPSEVKVIGAGRHDVGDVCERPRIVAGVDPGQHARKFAAAPGYEAGRAWAGREADAARPGRRLRQGVRAPLLHPIGSDRNDGDRVVIAFVAQKVVHARLRR